MEKISFRAHKYAGQFLLGGAFLILMTLVGVIFWRVESAWGALLAMMALLMCIYYQGRGSAKYDNLDGALWAQERKGKVFPLNVRLNNGFVLSGEKQGGTFYFDEGGIKLQEILWDSQQGKFLIIIQIDNPKYRTHEALVAVPAEEIAYWWNREVYHQEEAEAKRLAKDKAIQRSQSLLATMQK